MSGCECAICLKFGCVVRPEQWADSMLLVEADRAVAFDNLAKRCGHSGVKSVAIALNQAEKYGTPMGQALRITAQENREMRMQFAEQKAASLPAKLTVPMILFFLPCLFVVILGPAALRAMGMTH